MSENLRRSQFLALFVVLLTSIGASGDNLARVTLESYENDGISFLIPDGWKVTEDEEIGAFRLLFIESPDNAVLLVQLHPRDDSERLEKFVSSKRDGWIEDKSFDKIEVGSAFPIIRKINTVEYSGFEFRVTFEDNSVKVPHVTRCFLAKHTERNIYFTAQAPSEDLAAEEDGFDLILSSFLYVGSGG